MGEQRWFFGLMLGAGLLALPRWGEAACVIRLGEPADGATAVQSPTFRWTASGCLASRVLFSPSGTFEGDRTATEWGAARQYQWDEETWDDLQAGYWSGGVYWKVQARQAGGPALTSAGVRFVGMDPDADDDGVSVGGGDCDDGDARVFPGAEEMCDRWDNDCDGVEDEGFDQDGDGWNSCTGDCDDTDPAVHWGVTETCDGTNEDCDYETDEGFDQDADGWTTCEGDCNDADNRYHPEATPFCHEGWDFNCRGVPDVCEPAVDLPLEEADARFTGALDGGTSIYPVGDFDGDGYGDFLAPFADVHWPYDDNALYLVRGPVSGDVDYRVAADVVWESPGNDGAVVAAGDFTGDGLDDALFLVECDEAVHPVCAETPNVGAFALVAGDDAPAGGSLEDAVGGVIANDLLVPVFRAASAGDVDGDGIGDLVFGVVGMTGEAESSGGASLFYGGNGLDRAVGSPDARLLGEATMDYAGGAVGSGGDFNGDGYGDLLVSAPDYEPPGDPYWSYGVVYVVAGPLPMADSPLAEAEARILGTETAMQIASAVASAGDVNGDGYGDVLVAAEWYGAENGRVWLFLGPLQGELTVDEAAAEFYPASYDGNAHLGSSLAGVGDQDGDGLDDFLIGANGMCCYGDYPGLAYLVTSPNEGVIDLELADMRMEGGYWDLAGDRVASAGDQDGDGVPEMFISGNYTWAGYVVSFRAP